MTNDIKKALKLLDALAEPCEPMTRKDRDHAWCKCRHCLAVAMLEYGSDPGPRELLGKAAADLSRLTQENERLRDEREVYRLNGIREEERANKLLAEVSRLSARLQEAETMADSIQSIVGSESEVWELCRQFLAAHETP